MNKLIGAISENRIIDENNLIFPINHIAKSHHSTVSKWNLKLLTVFISEIDTQVAYCACHESLII